MYFLASSWADARRGGFARLPNSGSGRYDPHVVPGTGSLFTDGRSAMNAPVFEEIAVGQHQQQPFPGPGPRRGIWGNRAPWRRNPHKPPGRVETAFVAAPPWDSSCRTAGFPCSFPNSPDGFCVPYFNVKIVSESVKAGPRPGTIPGRDLRLRPRPAPPGRHIGKRCPGRSGLPGCARRRSRGCTACIPAPG